MPISNEEFKIKYSMYAQELMNISYGYTKNLEEAKDIIQNAFIKLINRAKGFKSLSHEKYWLIRVTINECKDLLRKKAKYTNIDDNSIDSLINFEDDKKLHIIAELVKKLPDKYKSVIILFYYDNQSIDTISKAIGISESAVKKRLERARNILKNEMEELQC